MNSIGSAPGKDIGFIEPLRWYALGGHSMTGMFEIIETFKLGNGGQTRFARSILSDYRGHLRMNTSVEKVEQRHGGVTVTTKDGDSLKARAIVCTIPLNCLGDIKFSPPLSPQRQEAIKLGHMNKGVKIHYKLRKAEPAFFSMANGYGKSPLCFAFSDHTGTGRNTGKGTYCIGFGYNNYLYNRDATTDIILGFADYMRPDSDVEGYATHDWVSDPFAKGAWSCWGPSGMSKHLAELQKAHGRVFMANADWANGWRGFIDGAIERGSVAAAEVRKLLQGDAQAAAKL
ncbi:hypothetical protein jhhlp_000686 [Lomentospora prolificans]|uniref:monoamine oxidase n=1 Tax=Lomentospora prolificans TaxID=41688 RepID=A0A2N3NJ67_9PEZI|nr:hypothetical protein jhhlp_000686 [Lomentospora prolificans]